MALFAGNRKERRGEWACLEKMDTEIEDTF
jgi:hypothetical protein